MFKRYAKGGKVKKKKSKSRVNEAGNYTKPEMRKSVQPYQGGNEGRQGWSVVGA